MFTGIIEETGRIVRIERGARLSSAPGLKRKKIFDDLGLGDSVAVNGVCLTVSRVERHGRRDERDHLEELLGMPQGREAESTLKGQYARKWKV